MTMKSVDKVLIRASKVPMGLAEVFRQNDWYNFGISWKGHTMIKLP